MDIQKEVESVPLSFSLSLSYNFIIQMYTNGHTKGGGTSLSLIIS